MVTKQVLNSADTEKWRSALDRYRSLRVGVHYLPEYHRLYLDETDTAEAFIYKQNDNEFFLPYVLRAMGTEYGMEEYFDLETVYGYGGPLATTDDIRFLQDAWQAFYQHCQSRGVIAGFLRFDPVVGNGLWYAPDFIGKLPDREVVLCSLDQHEDSLLRRYSQSARNKVRKALRLGLKVVFDSSKSAVEEFAHLYGRVMKQIGAHGSYFFGDVYFQQIKSTLDEQLHVIWVELDRVRIGASMLLVANGVVTYHLSAVENEYKKYGTASLLRHETIGYSRKKGWRVINFGGGKTGAPEDSLLKFKAGFSSEREVFFVGRATFLPEVYEKVCSVWEQRHQDSPFCGYHLKYRY